MAVVFDEVVTQVEGAPPQPQTGQEQGDEQRSPLSVLYCWQQQQTIVRRRQLRLEAD